MLIKNSYTIIDEADEMLHSDWEEDMAKIMAGGGKKASCTLMCHCWQLVQTPMKSIRRPGVAIRMSQPLVFNDDSDEEEDQDGAAGDEAWGACGDMQGAGTNGADEDGAGWGSAAPVVAPVADPVQDDWQASNDKAKKW
jgi:hypothetical protein